MWASYVNYFNKDVLENKEDLLREKDKEAFLKKIYEIKPEKDPEKYGNKPVYKKGDEFQKQINDLVNELKKYLPPTLKKVEDTCQAIINQFKKIDSLSADVQKQICEVGKRDLETFVYEAAKTPDLLLVESAFLTLTENLACTIGFLGDLEKAVGQILGGCNAILREARVKFAENEAQKFLFLKKPQEAKDFPGDHVHYIRDLTNFIADKFDIPFVKEGAKFTTWEKMQFNDAFIGRNNFIEELNTALVSVLDEKMSSVKDEDTQNKFLKRLQNLGKLHPSKEEYDKQAFFTELKPQDEKEVKEKEVKEKEVKEKEVKEKEVKEKEVKEQAESPTITLKKEATDHLRSSIMQRLVESNAIKKGVYQRLPFSSKKETTNVIYLDHYSDEKERNEILLKNSAESVYLLEQEKVLVYHCTSTQKPTALNFKKQFPNIKTAYIIHDNRLYFYRQPNTCIQTNLINELGEGEHKKFFQKILLKTTTTDNKDIKKVDISNKDLYKLIKCTALGPSPKIYYLQKKNPDMLHSLAISKEDFYSFIAEEKITDKTRLSEWLIEKTDHYMKREIVLFPHDLKSSYVLFQNKRYLLSDQNWEDLHEDQRKKLLKYLCIPGKVTERNFTLETKDITKISSYALAYLLKNKLIPLADVRTEFLAAIKNGNKTIVEKLCVHFDLNQPINDVNLLQHAAANNQTKMIGLLVSKGADFRKGLVAVARDEKAYAFLKNITANTPEKILAAFMFAVEMKDGGGLYLVHKLFHEGKVNAEDIFFDAIKQGRAVIIDRLFLYFDLNRPIHDINLLHLAAFNGHGEVVKMLIDRGADVQAGLFCIAEDKNDKNHRGFKIIIEKADLNQIKRAFLAAEKNNKPVLETLLKNIRDDVIEYLLTEFAKEQKWSALKAVIDVAWPSNIMNLLLSFAKEKEQCKKVVDMLVEWKVDIYHFLHYAVWSDNKAELELLLKTLSGHYDLNQKINGSYLLHVATYHGDTQIIDILISNGADLQVALLRAAEEGKECALTILMQKAGPSIVQSAILIAAKEGNAAIVKKLGARDFTTLFAKGVEKGEVKAGNDAILKLLAPINYNTLFSKAVEQGEVKALATLFSCCHPSKEIRATLFTSAVKHGHVEVAKTIYDNGADFSDYIESQIYAGKIDTLRMLISIDDRFIGKYAVPLLTTQLFENSEIIKCIQKKDDILLVMVRAIRFNYTKTISLLLPSDEAKKATTLQEALVQALFYQKEMKIPEKYIIQFIADHKIDLPSFILLLARNNLYRHFDDLKKLYPDKMPEFICEALMKVIKNNEMGIIRKLSTYSPQHSNYLRILDQKECELTVRNIKLAAILSIEKYRQGIASTAFGYTRSELLLNKIMSCGSEANICELINDFLLNGKMIYAQSDSLKFFDKVKQTVCGDGQKLKETLANTLKSLISVSDASSESLKVLMQNVHQVLNPQEPKTSMRMF